MYLLGLSWHEEVSITGKDMLEKQQTWGLIKSLVQLAGGSCLSLNASKIAKTWRALLLSV